MTKQEKVQKLVDTLVEEVIISLVDSKHLDEADIKARFTQVLSRVDELQPNPAVKHWNI